MDRNSFTDNIIGGDVQSLSARRAWIEITTRKKAYRMRSVALRKESVDRNVALSLLWNAPIVALRKESVDRNS
mgnify:CR=1 FL=1